MPPIAVSMEILKEQACKGFLISGYRAKVTLVQRVPKYVQCVASKKNNYKRGEDVTTHLQVHLTTTT